jgi:hypothetical protein
MSYDDDMPSPDDFINKCEGMLEDLKAWTDDFDNYLSSDDQYYDCPMDWVYPLKEELEEVINNLRIRG